MGFDIKMCFKNCTTAYPCQSDFTASETTWAHQSKGNENSVATVSIQTTIKNMATT